jgi:hypothetical protein
MPKNLMVFLLGGLLLLVMFMAFHWKTDPISEIELPDLVPGQQAKVHFQVQPFSQSNHRFSSPLYLV